MRKYLFLLFALFFLSLPFFDLRVEPVFAKEFICDPNIPGDCPTVGNPCPGACDALVTSSVCCQSLAGCYLQDYGTIPIWKWAHDPACTVTSVNVNTGIYECIYKWQFEQCDATDSCLSTPYLEAGLCASSGCLVGGDYKTCCSDTTGQVVSCTGGRFTGVCPAGSTAKVNCVGPSCCSAVATPTPVPGGGTGCEDASKWASWGGPCSNRNGNAAGCWSFGQFNGQPSCQYCTATNTCECGSCPTNPGCGAGDKICYNGGTCCRPAATVDNNTCTCSECSWKIYTCDCENLKSFVSGECQNCGDGGMVERKEVEKQSEARICSANIASGTQVNYRFDTHLNTYGNCVRSITINWGDGSPLERRVSPSGGERCLTIQSNDSFVFTHTYNNYSLTSRSYIATVSVETFAENDANCKSVHTFPNVFCITRNVSPTPGRIIGNVYKNTTGLSCTTANAQNGKTLTITNNSGYSCVLNTDTNGYYDSNNCSGAKPQYSGTYIVSLGYDAANEACSSSAACGGTSCSQQIVVDTIPKRQDFTLVPKISSWFQTAYGDLHGNGGVGTTIPNDTCSGTCSPYLSLGTANTAGVVSAGGNFTGNIETKNLFSNPNNWKVKDSATENFTGFGGNLTKYDYGFFYKKLGSPTTNNFSGSLPGASGTYYSSAAVTTSGSWTVGANQKIIILVNGNLTIGTEIAVPTTSFLAFIVSGNISIDKNLGVNPNANPNSAKVVEGVYLADGFIKTVPDGETALPNKKFVASGIFVAYGGFSFGRDLGSYNSSYAAEYFEYRPDFLVNFPSAFGVNRLTWQEVAP